MGKGFKQTFFQRGYKNDQLSHEKCLTSLFIMEMQIKLQ